MTDTANPIGRIDAASLAGAAPARGAEETARSQSASFADLLRLAQEGKLSSDRPVDVSPRLDLELTDEDLQRVAWAVDQAEASGARSALVMLDGEGLLVDVTTRRIEALADEPGKVLTAVEAVVIAPRADGSIGTGVPGPLGPPLQRLTNQSLRDLLAAAQQAT